MVQVVRGQTSMSVTERKFIAETCVKATKNAKQHLMIQIEGPPLSNVIERKYNINI